MSSSIGFRPRPSRPSWRPLAPKEASRIACDRNEEKECSSTCGDPPTPGAKRPEEGRDARENRRGSRGRGMRIGEQVLAQPEVVALHDRESGSFASLFTTREVRMEGRVAEGLTDIAGVGAPIGTSQWWRRLAGKLRPHLRHHSDCPHRFHPSNIGEPFGDAPFHRTSRVVNRLAKLPLSRIMQSDYFGLRENLFANSHAATSASSPVFQRIPAFSGLLAPGVGGSPQVLKHSFSSLRSQAMRLASFGARGPPPKLRWARPETDGGRHASSDHDLAATLLPQAVEPAVGAGPLPRTATVIGKPRVP